MSFLTPLFLLGGLAIAGPIIYHLIRRATRERTRFSSLMFLLPSPPRLSKRHRLEHIVLLILRCLALALLALGFARPFLKQTPLDDPTAAQPKRTVVLVDASASMRREGVWAAARERAEQLLRQAGPADQVALFTFERAAAPLVSFDEWNRTAAGDRAAFAIGRLGGVTPGWSGTHLGNALVTAAEAFAETEANKATTGPRQVVLVSDLQAGSRLEGLQAYEWPKGVELFVEPVKARNVTNAGVQLVADAADANRPVDAATRVRVTNAADSKRETFKVGWTRVPAGPGGEMAAPEFAGPTIDAYVPPGQSRVFAVPALKDAPAATHIALQGDDEPFDNVVHVIPAAQQRTEIVWLGDEKVDDATRPLFFLRRAFTDTPRLAVEITVRAAAEALPVDAVKEASLIFVADAISPATATTLREQAETGKTIVFAPKTPEAMGTFGALLGREGIAAEEVRPGTYAMFAEIDFRHPLFAPFADPRFSDFTKIHIWRYRKIDPTSLPDARVVAKFDSGDPALIEMPLGKGRVFVLATGWHPDDSQLAVSTKFVPLLWSLLELSGGAATAPTQYFVGDRVNVPADATATSVRAPGGTNVALRAEAAEFSETLRPGVYEFVGGTQPRRFAVNLDANESRTAPLGPDELEHLGVPIARTPSKAGEAKTAENQILLQGAEAENRQKLWRWFIVATLAVLLIESAFAGWTARRAPAEAEVAT